MRRLFDVHRRIKKPANLLKGCLLKSIVESWRVFEYQKPTLGECVPQVTHELVAIRIKIEPINRWNFVQCL
jgi:hypothetical protein